jgi:predicted ferric reductase
LPPSEGGVWPDISGTQMHPIARTIQLSGTSFAVLVFTIVLTALIGVAAIVYSLNARAKLRKHHHQRVFRRP